MKVRDYSGANGHGSGVRGYQIPADRYSQSTIGSVRVTRDRIVAWIGCNIQNEFARMRGCTRPGSRAWVYRSMPTGDPRFPYIRKLLDRGRRIDPSSLRLAGTRLSWIHSGKRRYAELK